MKKDAKLIGIWGGRGTGKTTRQKELMRGADGRGRPWGLIALDPMNEFTGMSRVGSVRDVAGIMKDHWYKGFAVSLSTGHRENDCLKALRELVPLLFAAQGPYRRGEKSAKEITLIVDEAHKFFPNRKFSPGEGDAEQDLIALGRHYGIEVIGASQRLAKVSTEFRGNCAEHYFFRQSDYNDTAAAAQFVGSQNKDRLMALKPHHYLHFSAGQIREGKNACNFR